ncbi:MAG: PVC-type heme-binding CxxCH protein [Rhodothermales bacterium]
MHTLFRTATHLAVVCLLLLSPCIAQDGAEASYARLTPEERRLPEWAATGLTAAEGLEVSLFAAEPLLVSPSNMDVDHLGRVWVLEVVNYRIPRNPNNPERPEGDHILILEDTSGDGVADEQTVFYQGTDINAALGIAVLGDRVVVSASPNVFVFTDEDGDGRADAKEVLFTGIDGEDHDHGMHAVVFGPDGKFYFNFGNAGRQILDRDGNVIVDRSGSDVVEGDEFREGMVFRSNPDGSAFEVLGHNFRNNYEVAVDAFGTMWQSDNDDDGNRSVRINYVMEYGNFGYVDEITGAGWRAARTNREELIPDRHWHLNDPGVVPNLLHTGAGSPTGILVYEGDLLPARFQGQIIHADAGPNVVRGYPVTTDGAGYRATMLDVVRGTRDQRFRPADVTTAPDGSLFIADWYDPVVGGHEKADAEGRGRVFRVAPPGVPYRVPDVDVSSAEGAAEALKSPNQAVRYLAWNRLHALQREAEPALIALWESDRARYRARALWLLSKIDGRGEHYVMEALADDDPDIRATAVRAVRQLDANLVPFLRRVVNDPSPQVRREVAIALRYLDADEMPELWAELALQHDGADRWYLEALGIGAEGPSRANETAGRQAGRQANGEAGDETGREAGGEAGDQTGDASDTRWNAVFATWQDRVGEGWDTPGGRDVVWRARATAAMPLLAVLILDDATTDAERLRYFRAFDFHDDPSRDRVLLDLLRETPPDRPQVRALALKHVTNASVIDDPSVLSVLEETLAALRGTQLFVDLVSRFDMRDRGDELIDIVVEEPTGELALEAVRQLVRLDGGPAIADVLSSGDVEASTRLVRGLGRFEDTAAKDLLERFVLDPSMDVSVRREAVRGLGTGWGGERRLLEMIEAGHLPSELHAAAADVLLAASRAFIRDGVARHLDVSTSALSEELQPIQELAARTGDPDAGRTVFERACSSCHLVSGSGVPFGPELTEVGSKLPKEGLYLSILDPNAGINFGYEPYLVRLHDGGEVVGFIQSRTDEAVDVRVRSGVTQRYARSDIASISRLDASLMPEGLHRTMTENELVNLVEYLTTLRANESGP